jgi:hypothetical protein
MTLTMYDAEDNAQFPPGAPAYASYIDGHGGDQPNYAHVTAAFPGAHHLSIALFASDDADALDVEPGAAVPGQIPIWVARQRARGIARPCLYASVSNMADEILPVLALARIPIASVRLWSAHYGAGEHICGPRSCGDLPVGADGTQWTSGALGRPLDQSVLLDDFFGAIAAPPTREVTVQVQLAALAQGSSGQQVRNWQGLLIAHGYGFMLGSVPGTTVEDGAGVDGDFGPKTAAATEAFKGAKGLTGTGVDGATWAAALG